MHLPRNPSRVGGGLRTADNTSCSCSFAGRDTAYFPHAPSRNDLPCRPTWQRRGGECAAGPDGGGVSGHARRALTAGVECNGQVTAELLESGNADSAFDPWQARTSGRAVIDDFRDVLREFVAHRVTFLVVGAHALAVHVLGKATFLANKRASGRPKDLADLKALGE